MTRTTEPRRNRKWVWLALGLGVALAGVGGWLGQRRAKVMAALPTVPPLENRAAELADRIAGAQREAHGWLHPERGLVALARLYEANGFYPEALDCQAALRRIEPREARWWHLAAGIHAGFGRADEARPLWERAIELAPDYLPARIRLGDSLLKSNQAAAAVQVYEAALAVSPRQPYALLGLARSRVNARDWTGARTHLQAALAAEPGFVGALSLLVTVEEKLGDQAAARRLRSEIGGREFTDIPDPWAEELTDDCYDAYRLSVAAAVARHRGDPARSRALLERAVDLAPAAGTYRRQLGQLLLHLQDYSPARRHLEKAVAIAPTDTDAWLQLVEVFTALQMPAEAERTLGAGLAANPGSAALYYAAGRRLSAAGRLGEAAAAFSRAKQLRPSEANAYVDLAGVYFQLGRIEAGIAELEAALVVQPGHALAMQILARHAINTGDEAAARRWLAQLRGHDRVAPDDLALIVKEYTAAFHHAPQ